MNITCCVLSTHTISHETVSLLFPNSALTENVPYRVLLSQSSVATANKPVCSSAVQFLGAIRISCSFTFLITRVNCICFQFECYCSLNFNNQEFGGSQAVCCDVSPLCREPLSSRMIYILTYYMEQSSS